MNGTRVWAVATAFFLLVGVAQTARADIAYACGRNTYGQLGDGTTIDRWTPVPVSGLSSSVTVAAGGWSYSLAIQNGAVYAWGFNHESELGDGTTTNRSTPVAVLSLTGGVAERSYGLYEQFRPRIEPGKAGWGQKGALDLDLIRSLGKL